jgi:hypothetical protein
LAFAVGGAYLGVKLIGTMIGNYPDETMIAQRIAAGEFEGVRLFLFNRNLDAMVQLCLYHFPIGVGCCWNRCAVLHETREG